MHFAVNLHATCQNCSGVLKRTVNSMGKAPSRQNCALETEQICEKLAHDTTFATCVGWSGIGQSSLEQPCCWNSPRFTSSRGHLKPTSAKPTHRTELDIPVEIWRSFGWTFRMMHSSLWCRKKQLYLCNFVTTRFTACILGLCLPFTSRPLKWRTLLYHPSLRKRSIVVQRYRAKNRAGGSKELWPETCRANPPLQDGRWDAKGYAKLVPIKLVPPMIVLFFFCQLLPMKKHRRPYRVEHRNSRWRGLKRTPDQEALHTYNSS